MRHPSITVIGGGLVGALLGCLLAKRGMPVAIFEKRADPRRGDFAGGRSINLALTERGLHALRVAGLADSVLAHAVMMRGRMVHPLHGTPGLQRYGIDDSEVIWSAARGALNGLQLDAAEQAGARVHFGQTLAGADFHARRICLSDAHGTRREIDADLLIGADGAGSALRAAMAQAMPLGERIEPLGHGYKELEIPPAHVLPEHVRHAMHGRFALEPHALHIWPRGGYMGIALPNAEGSFTVTLFLPMRGSTPSFEQLPDAAAARAFFAQDFADLLPLLSGFDHDYAAHPVGTLATLHLQRWHLDDRAVLIGDAAHAIVPFHGQGMNCGFEDAVALAERLTAAPGDPGAAFAAFQDERQPNTEAIATMSVENYVEMRDSVADPAFLARRALGDALAARVPTHYMSRYRMISFTRWPYAYALERGRQQDTLLDELLAGHTDPTRVDMAAAETLLRQRLPPLPGAND